MEREDLARVLPPLDSLILWAKQNSPFLKTFDSAKELGEGKVALEKRSWLQFISLDASYGYGIYDNLSNQQLAGDLSSQVLFTTLQNRYQAGVTLRMPLDALLNRKQVIHNTMLEAEKYSYEQQQAEYELSLRVTDAYNEVLKSHRLLYINTTIVDTFRAQTERAELEFANGVINVADYTRLLQMINQSQMALETQKADFFKAFLTLENIVGVDLKI